MSHSSTAVKRFSCSCKNELFHELEFFADSGYRESSDPSNFVRFLECSSCRNVWRFVGGTLPQLYRRTDTTK
jgi:hypothetical protein